jgi:hypothetical protein
MAKKKRNPSRGTAGGLRAARNMTAARARDLLTVEASSEEFPVEDGDRPVGAMTNDQLVSTIKNIVKNGDRGVLLFKAAGNIWARVVSST